MLEAIHFPEILDEFEAYFEIRSAYSLNYSWQKNNAKWYADLEGALGYLATKLAADSRCGYGFFMRKIKNLWLPFTAIKISSISKQFANPLNVSQAQVSQARSSLIIIRQLFKLSSRYKYFTEAY